MQLKDCKDQDDYARWLVSTTEEFGLTRDRSSWPMSHGVLSPIAIKAVDIPQLVENLLKQILFHRYDNHDIYPLGIYWGFANLNVHPVESGRLINLV